MEGEKIVPQRLKPGSICELFRHDRGRALIQNPCLEEVSVNCKFGRPDAKRIFQRLGVVLSHICENRADVGRPASAVGPPSAEPTLSAMKPRTRVGHPNSCGFPGYIS